MNRRGFLGAILAAGVAPYVITKAGVLMPGRGVIVPTWVGVDWATAHDQTAIWLRTAENQLLLEIQTRLARGGYGETLVSAMLKAMPPDRKWFTLKLKDAT